MERFQKFPRWLDAVEPIKELQLDRDKKEDPAMASKWIAAVVLLWVSVSVVGTAQDLPQNSPLGGVHKSGVTEGTSGVSSAASSHPTMPGVLLKTVDQGKVTVWRGFAIECSVDAGSLPSGIGVKSLVLSIPPALGVAGGTEARLINQEFSINQPGGAYEIPPTYLKPSGLRELGGSFFTLLTYRPGKERLVATLTYEDLANPGSNYQVTRPIEIEVEPNPLGMYAGALLGSFLTALLVLTHRLTGQKDVPAPTGSIGSEFSGRLLRGTVSTGLVILLFQTTSDLKLPVTIAVHDLYGGVLLGLFGDKIGETLMNWIFSKEPVGSAPAQNPPVVTMTPGPPQNRAGIA
jgi:hypothetical protein